MVSECKTKQMFWKVCQRKILAYLRMTKGKKSTDVEKSGTQKKEKKSPRRKKMTMRFEKKVYPQKAVDKNGMKKVEERLPSEEENALRREVYVMMDRMEECGFK